MPQSENLDAALFDTVVQKISNATEMNAADVFQIRIRCLRARVRLLRNESEPALNFLLEGFRRLFTISQPPRSCFLNVRIRDRRDLDGQHRGTVYGSRLRTFSASINSPRSASAIDCRRVTS